MTNTVLALTLIIITVWFTFWWFNFNATNNAWYNWATWMTIIVIWLYTLINDL